jgi:hypothetical protein
LEVKSFYFNYLGDKIDLLIQRESFKKFIKEGLCDLKLVIKNIFSQAKNIKNKYEIG